MTQQPIPPTFVLDTAGRDALSPGPGWKVFNTDTLILQTWDG